MESRTHPHFPVHRCAVRDGLAIGYWRAGEGGYPLLLVHGFPETKRIWARNVAPLAEAGFDVIVPDLRGVGDSDPASDAFYDPPAYARDLRALCERLGIERCGAAAGDVGAMVVAELGLRFPGFVERQCLFNTLAPPLLAAFAAAGIPEDPPPAERPEMDYFVRQGSDADGLLAELDTPERRRGYVGAMYAERGWASTGSFTAGDVDAPLPRAHGGRVSRSRGSVRDRELGSLRVVGAARGVARPPARVLPRSAVTRWANEAFAHPTNLLRRSVGWANQGFAHHS